MILPKFPLPPAAPGKPDPTKARQVHGGHLFHTYLRALGFDSRKNFYIDQRPIPMADPKAAPITEVLA